MQIGQVIRKYRKIKDMTQEEMANRLGVTAPAVNKWENGNSMPDIALLAPIARLLGISLDTLLDYKGDLTDNEVNELVETLREKLKAEEFDAAFQWAKKQMEQYPGCEHLLLWMTMLLDAGCIEEKIPEERYEKYLLAVKERLLGSNEEYVRTTAADALCGFYIRKELYDKAEEYLDYFSTQNPDRKRKQALLYARTGRTKEAYKIYEELLYAEFQVLHMTFHSMFSMRLEEGNLEKAEYLADKILLLVRAFGMGRYYEASTRLELMQAGQDVQGTLACVRQMLENCGQLLPHHVLYEHMTFKEISDDFVEKMKQTLLALCRDEDSFGYMKGNEEWKRLTEGTVNIETEGSGEHGTHNQSGL